MAEANWYVVHTYSGYETKVKANIEKTIENRHLEDEILEVRVPLQDVVEMKNGARRVVQKKLFPGYVLINMVMNDDTWYVVRNTRGVTGFVGPGSKPVPLTEAEMKPLGIQTENVSIDFGEGDMIVVVAGAWKDTVGVVQKIDYSKQTATINVELFGSQCTHLLGNFYAVCVAGIGVSAVANHCLRHAVFQVLLCHQKRCAFHGVSGVNRCGLGRYRAENQR